MQLTPSNIHTSINLHILQGLKTYRLSRIPTSWIEENSGIKSQNALLHPLAVLLASVLKASGALAVDLRHTTAEALLPMALGLAFPVAGYSIQTATIEGTIGRRLTARMEVTRIGLIIVDRTRTLLTEMDHLMTKATALIPTTFPHAALPWSTTCPRALHNLRLIPIAMVRLICRHIVTMGVASHHHPDPEYRLQRPVAPHPPEVNATPTSRRTQAPIQMPLCPSLEDDTIALATEKVRQTTANLYATTTPSGKRQTEAVKETGARGAEVPTEIGNEETAIVTPTESGTTETEIGTGIADTMQQVDQIHIVDRSDEIPDMVHTPVQTPVVAGEKGDMILLYTMMRIERQVRGIVRRGIRDCHCTRW
jgi:hypothetical protein